CLWLVLTLLCSAIMLYQIFDRAIYYYSWPVTVNVKINFNESLQFPTVTICNQNSFRATAAEEAGHYSLVSSLFQDVGSSNVSHLDILNAYNLSYGDLYKESGHQPQDMIIKCRWKGEFCDWRNFSAIYTDSGLCYSFNALAREGADFLTVDAPGHNVEHASLVFVSSSDHRKLLNDLECLSKVESTHVHVVGQTIKR
ncbi:acid-sensing ion channel 5-like, partial [Plakobranchus ocellatus]